MLGAWKSEEKVIFGVFGTIAAITLNWYVTRKLDEWFPVKKVE